MQDIRYVIPGKTSFDPKGVMSHRLRNCSLAAIVHVVSSISFNLLMF